MWLSLFVALKNAGTFLVLAWRACQVVQFLVFNPGCTYQHRVRLGTAFVTAGCQCFNSHIEQAERNSPSTSSRVEPAHSSRRSITTEDHSPRRSSTAEAEKAAAFENQPEKTTEKEVSDDEDEDDKTGSIERHLDDARVDLHNKKALQMKIGGEVSQSSLMAN